MSKPTGLARILADEISALTNTLIYGVFSDGVKKGLSISRHQHALDSLVVIVRNRVNSRPVTVNPNSHSIRMH